MTRSVSFLSMWVATLAAIMVFVADAAASGGFGVSKFTVETTTAVETPQETSGEVFNDVYVSEPATQAGGHPFALTTTLEFNSEEIGGGRSAAGGDPKDVVTDLPPGLLGDPMAVPRCALAIFANTGHCPPSSQVGIIEAVFAGSILIEPIYNIVPEMGQSAEFGIPTGGSFNLILTGHLVHTSAGYGFTVVSNAIPQRGYTRFKVTFWGVPADPRHDPQRGRRCETSNYLKGEPITCANNGLDNPGGEKAGVAPVPFLIMPSNCAAAGQAFKVEVDSWQNPGVYEAGPEATFPAATGCDALSFDPSLEVSPDTTAPDSPVGLGVDLRVPQPEEPGVLDTPNLRNAVVTLPPGVSINPGIVDGVQVCEEEGPNGIDIPNGLNSKGEPLRRGEYGLGEAPGPSGEAQLSAGNCPDASIVGTAEAISPLLPEPVKGHLYLAAPLCGRGGQPACTEEDSRTGRLYRLYLELGGKGALASSGINIKARGVVSANPATGQITSTFADNPQTPFSELKLHLNGGARASLANPQTCGEARTTSDFSPWSAPGRTPEGLLVAGTPDADPFSYYQVEGCSNPSGLSPRLIAGTTAPTAAEFTPFTLDLTRKDGEQDLSAIQVKTPPGLLGMLSNVPLCTEPAAKEGTCPEASRIGKTRVATGAGSHPFEIEGAVYLTGPYCGARRSPGLSAPSAERCAPFGLSVVTHAVAGPFNLGLIVVRARIDVDLHTSALTVTSDPLPQIVFGVPLRLQRIMVDIDRENFMFNPTTCKTQEIAVKVAGNQGATPAVSVPFTVKGCKSLGFKPRFSVSTSAKTSRATGASLDTKLSYPSGSQGVEANIARVKVSLPRQLPSRLSTLQHACPAQTFDINPASCDKRSIVGIARSRTPLLPVELSGPVYFVSHGGEAFPSLIIVLQGYGVRVDVTGTTFISKAGITSTTLKSVPDVPVSSFELYLPESRSSALAATGSLCKSRAKLVMPTTFVAQNGAKFHQNTKIAVNGCPRSRSKSKANKRIIK
jgi:hypothetical protein